MSIVGIARRIGKAGRSRLRLAAAVLAVIGIGLATVNIDRAHTADARRDLETRLTHRLHDVRNGLGSVLTPSLAFTRYLSATMSAADRESDARLFGVRRNFVTSHVPIDGVVLAPDLRLDSAQLAELGMSGDVIDRLQAAIGALGAGASGPSAAIVRTCGADQLCLIAVNAAQVSPAQWNGAVTVMRRDSILGFSHILDETTPDIALAVALVDRQAPDGDLTGTELLYGIGIPAEEHPLSASLDLEGTRLEISILPSSGWADAIPTDWLFDVMLYGTGGLLILTVLLSAIILNQRDQNIAALRIRDARWRLLSERFDLAMRSSNIGIWEYYPAEHRLIWDSRTAVLHGCRTDGDENLNRMGDWLGAVHPDDRVALSLIRVEPGSTREWSCRVLLADGGLRTLKVACLSSEDEDGRSRLTGVAWDATADTTVREMLEEAKEGSDIKNAELELALEELTSREHDLSELSHKFDLALASYNCGLWETDASTGNGIWDERMHQLHGIAYQDGTVTRSQWLQAVHPEDRSTIRKRFEGPIAPGKTVQTVSRILHDDGSFRYVRSVGQLHVGRDGRLKTIGIAFDVTSDVLMTEELKLAKEEADNRAHELELAKSRIEFNALHDTLTGLANRRMLDIELDELVPAGSAAGDKFAILHLDLDRFKEINDTLGHAAGDAVLVHAAQVLCRHVGLNDLVARMGGDEFVILVRGHADREALSAMSESIIEEMSLPIDFEGFGCRCGVSIGIATARTREADPRKVLINADIALYRAKERGRNCHEFFTPELEANIVRSRQLADEMLDGLDRNEFVAWYQPQFDARSMELVGAEALIRWQHPERGLLTSGAFLKTAEELNVMARIDSLVLEQSLIDKMRLAALGVRLPRVSVNVSAKRLHDTGLIEHLKTLSLTPGEICFELVESIFLDDGDNLAAHNIDAIKALGVDIEIDDFGTGHTSIVSLLRLKPKRLKIDRQLVMPIVHSPRERSLVRSIVEISRSLGIECVAEGVETEEHAAMLRELGCDMLQGYAFAKPLPFDQLAALALRPPMARAS
ncbi:bifunctional diguanylate cyclase/phosphodiesterase [Rhizobium halophytocola]|uniref:Diguanylate cyclase (GGDEF)-like protein n=1 Tax=Rhizobium halophytocola TaxID=735519 RepID=A0ABS4DXA3_9HYPH|nr:GGDEF domain-containing phosphodiesterase [Rhizobium halophytocola]MBP1850329.1 diguanylate cyclase (GGDEF)-like protein [Rhizobium halophytocola]